MGAVKVKVHNKAVIRAMERVKKTRSPAVAHAALQGTSFEVLQDVKIHVRAKMRFAGPTTAKFLSGKKSFKFKMRGKGTMRVRSTVSPKPTTANILAFSTKSRSGWKAKDDRGLIARKGSDNQSPGHKPRLRKDMIAVPVRGNVKRTKRGKVRVKRTPSQILGPGGRGFVNLRRTAIVERLTPRSRDVRVAYMLTDRAKNPQLLDLQKVAIKTVRREFPKKAAKALRKFKAGKI